MITETRYGVMVETGWIEENEIRPATDRLWDSRVGAEEWAAINRQASPMHTFWVSAVLVHYVEVEAP